MRPVLSVLGLLAVAAIIGLLSKQQLSTKTMSPANAPASPVQQSQQLQQRYRQAIEDAMRQPRPSGDEAR